MTEAPAKSRVSTSDKPPLSTARSSRELRSSQTRQSVQVNRFTGVPETGDFWPVSEASGPAIPDEGWGQKEVAEGCRNARRDLSDERYSKEKIYKTGVTDPAK